MTGNKPKGIGVLAAGGRVAAAQRAVRDMVTDGTGAVLPCPWTAEDVVRFRSVARGKPESWRDIDDTLTPNGYRLVLVRPLEGELVRWRVQRIIGTSSTGLLGPTAIGGETVGHVVIGRSHDGLGRWQSAMEKAEPADGLVYLVVS